MSSRRKKHNKTYRAFLSLMAGVGVLAILAGWLLDRAGWASIPSASAEHLSPIHFSEVQNHSTYPLPGIGSSAWVELENASDEAVSLRGLRLTRDDLIKKTLVFPNITLEPHGYLLICADGTNATGTENTLHAPFKLPKSGAHELFLYDEGATLLDHLDVPSMGAGESWCLGEDGEWSLTAAPTPGASNALVQRGEEPLMEGDVVLNEIVTCNPMLYPDEDGEFTDYVELLNRSDHPVDLEDYALSDNPERPVKWHFPAVTLGAGETLVLHCSGENRISDPGHLHVGFKLSTGEVLRLYAPDGKLIDAVTLPELRAGQALSRAEDGWTDTLPPTPNAGNVLAAAMRLDGEMRARQGSGVAIAEVMAIPVSEPHDWLELANATDGDVDLSGWGLSNDAKRPRKWQFPAGTVIPARGILPVMLVGVGGDTSSRNYLSADFGLSGIGGRSVCLSDANGRLVDHIDLPRQYAGISYGRDAAGACGYLAQATPAAPNGAGVLMAPVSVPEYSVPGGVYHTGDRFEVSITAQPGARVYYTLDFTEPDETKTLYTGAPIPVSGTTILRTRAYMDGCLPSEKDCQSYLFDVNAAAEVPYVVSLVADPEDLYSDETGIMVKGLHDNIHQEWEREAHVELFARGASPAVVSQECGVKLHGRNTRNYELKCFKVMAKSKYGSNRFRHPIFRDRPYDEYEAFILRYAGQDFKYAFMRDVVMTGMAANTSVMYMEAEEAVVYLNGEYYSAMYVRENISPFSLARREGWVGQEDRLDLVKSGYDVKQGSNDAYLALKAYLESTDNNSQAVYDRIASEVDIDNFIEYCAMYVTFCPPDTVNVKRYRNTAADGKWRWVLFDLDRGLRADTTNGFELLAQGTNAQLFRAFMGNDALRDRFLKYLNTALSTFLSSNRMEAAVREQFERTKPMLPDYLQRIGVSQSAYENSLRSLVKDIRLRPERVLTQCQETLKLSDADMRAYFADAYAAIEAGKEQ